MRGWNSLYAVSVAVLTLGCDLAPGSKDGAEEALAPNSGGDPGTDPAVPSACPAAADDLASLWIELDAQHERGEGVALGDGYVAWVATGYDGGRLRAHDLDGGELWAADVDAEPGEGALRGKGVGAAGAVVLAAAGASGPYVRGFDGSGAPSFEVELSEFFAVEGVAMHDDGTFAVAGYDGEDMLIAGFDADGTSRFLRTLDAGAGESSQAVTAAADGGLFVAGHSNGAAAPVYARLDASGAVLWSIALDAGTDLEVAQGVATDLHGGAFFSVEVGAGGRIDHVGDDGALRASFEVDYTPEALTVDADGRLAVAGRSYADGVVIVERLTADGDLISRVERPGSWGLAIAADRDCDVYLAGAGKDGAFLEKLD